MLSQVQALELEEKIILYSAMSNHVSTMKIGEKTNAQKVYLDINRVPAPRVGHHTVLSTRRRSLAK